LIHVMYSELKKHLIKFHITGKFINYNYTVSAKTLLHGFITF